MTKNADELNTNDWKDASGFIDLSKFSDNFFRRFKYEVHWFWIIDNTTITTEFAHRFQKEIGSKRWFHNGKLHRENGPAIIYPSGFKYWYLNGMLMNYVFETDD